MPPNRAVKNNFSISKNRITKAYLIAITLTIIGALFSLSTGSVYVKPANILAIVLKQIPIMDSGISKVWSSTDESIILYIRLPRLILAFLVGAELSAAGVIYQGIFRNPMADPYIIGASSGASLGAAIAIVFFSGMTLFGMGLTPLFAFAGALLTIVIVYGISKIAGRTYTFTLLLAGIAISSFISAFVSFLMYFSDEKLHQIYSWVLGSFSSQGWNEVFLNLPYGICGIALGYLNLRALNILQLGENTAFFTGVDTEHIKRVCLGAASLLTAAAVAVSGVIGFVGLVIPHITRIIIGPDHRSLYPLSAIIGGLYLMLADTVARVILSPTEVPVGIITALLGGPFFLFLLFGKKNRNYIM